jgi:hypothetical protein
VDRAAIERLITALTRVLGTAPASTGPDRAWVVGVPGLEFVESRGGAWVLDGLWHRLGIDTLLRRLAAGTRRDPIVERVLVALVANRALARRQSWPRPRGLPTTYTSRAQTVSDDACYRAMDWLIAVEPQLVRGVFNAVADLQPRGRSDLLRHHQHLLRDRDSSGNTSMGSTRRRFTEEYKELIQNPTRCPHFRGSRTTSQDREGRSE